MREFSAKWGFLASSVDLPSINKEEATLAYDTPYAAILVEIHGRVGLIRLNRPEALNALNSQILADLLHIFGQMDKDPAIGAIVLTGSEKAFAAGADIKEMAGHTYPQTYIDDFISGWDQVAATRKPIIAAVAGFALGGGCELAMLCDFILAAENAKFGQPEIKLGVMPGMGGSQRLARAVGKAKAMEMCLTGRMMDAIEAERAGLVSRIVPVDKLIEEALSTAATIADYALPVVLLNKEAVARAFEGTLAEGLRFERRVFQGLFGTKAQIEGMSAFVEKRKARFNAP
jgi:enoyl-CoA hydratase